MSIVQNELFSIMNKISLELRLWWKDLGGEGQDEVKKYLKGLIGLLEIMPRGDIIRALVTCWDPVSHLLFSYPPRGIVYKRVFPF